MRLHASITLPLQEASRLEAALRPEFVHSSELTWLHPNHWRLHIAGFGSVVQGDSLRLSALLAEHVIMIKAPSLRISGISALPEEGDDGVWADLDGDLDVMAAIANEIPRWVLEFGFVPDRRSYRSRVRLAKITPKTTAGFLESLVARHSGFSGAPWTPEGVTLGYTESGTAEREPSLHAVSMAYFAGELGKHAAADGARTAG